MTTKTVAWLQEWNRKLHYYLGLYFLLFLWLFAITGLIMNHATWFPYKPPRTTTEHTLRPPRVGSGLERAQDVARQLGLTGEVILPASQSKPDRFGFTLVRPGLKQQIEIDLATGHTRVLEITLSTLDTFKTMHTHNGLKMTFNEPAPLRDWGMTSVWTFFMDALSIGLIFMVLSSMYMWYQLRTGRILGLAITVAGFLSAAFFLWGLR